MTVFGTLKLFSTAYSFFKSIIFQKEQKRGNEIETLKLSPKFEMALELFDLKEEFKTFLLKLSIVNIGGGYGKIVYFSSRDDISYETVSKLLYCEKNKEKLNIKIRDITLQQREKIDIFMESSKNIDYLLSDNQQHLSSLSIFYKDMHDKIRRHRIWFRYVSTNSKLSIDIIDHDELEDVKFEADIDQYGEKISTSVKYEGASPFIYKGFSLNPLYKTESVEKLTGKTIIMKNELSLYGIEKIKINSIKVDHRGNVIWEILVNKRIVVKFFMDHQNICKFEILSNETKEGIKILGKPEEDIKIIYDAINKKAIEMIEI